MEEGKEVANKETQNQIEKFTKKINDLIIKFKQGFPPAADEASSTHLLSTNDIRNILEEHDMRIDFEIVSLTDLLEKAGYKYKAIEEEEEIGFKWLIAGN